MPKREPASRGARLAVLLLAVAGFCYLALFLRTSASSDQGKALRAAQEQHALLATNLTRLQRQFDVEKAAQAWLRRENAALRAENLKALEAAEARPPPVAPPPPPPAPAVPAVAPPARAPPPAERDRLMSAGSVLAALDLRRVLYCVTAYDRKQHVHLKQMILAAVSMCEGGAFVTLVIYTADKNPYTPQQADEMAQLAVCSAPPSLGSLTLQIETRPGSLELAMTMEHRNEMKRMIDQFDLFVYMEVRAPRERARRVGASFPLLISGARAHARAPLSCLRTTCTSS